MFGRAGTAGRGAGGQESGARLTLPVRPVLPIPRAQHHALLRNGLRETPLLLRHFHFKRPGREGARGGVGHLPREIVALEPCRRIMSSLHVHIAQFYTGKSSDLTLETPECGIRSLKVHAAHSTALRREQLTDPHQAPPARTTSPNNVARRFHHRPVISPSPWTRPAPRSAPLRRHRSNAVPQLDPAACFARAFVRGGCIVAARIRLTIVWQVTPGASSSSSTRGCSRSSCIIQCRGADS